MVLIATALVGVRAAGAEGPLATFSRQAQPVLDTYCYDCHGGGFNKGGVTLDEFKSDGDVQDHKLWLRVMKNVRAGIMPPAGETRLPPQAERQLMSWIKLQAFSLDPKHPDPGRVTLRRLNRVEYRNTIKDLVGVDFDSLTAFPADDTVQGFDNLGDVLSISPLLLERYLDAAQTIVTEAVPTQPRAVAVHAIRGKDFVLASGPAPTAMKAAADPAGAPSSAEEEEGPPPTRHPLPVPKGDALDLSYYTPVTVAGGFAAAHAGDYEISFTVHAVEKYVNDFFDLNKCVLVFAADGHEFLRQRFVREGEDKAFTFSYRTHWTTGQHRLTFAIEPLAPERPQYRLLRVRLDGVTIRGPEAPKYWVPPARYAEFFPQRAPASSSARDAYAAQLLRRFASRAFRRPVEEATVRRLVAMADAAAAEPNGTFESGVAQAMVAVLASPRFIFRVEDVEPLQPGEVNPMIDEFALASRLSYFLWSSMPDDELFRLAGAGQLRANLPREITRMLADPRSEEFIRNFTGQWLEARDIGTVQVDPLAVYLRDHPNPQVDRAIAAFQTISMIEDDKRTPEQKEALKTARTVFKALSKQPKPKLSDSLREAMRRESEMDFAYVVRQNRSLLELIDCNYTFLNAELARHYGLPPVEGSEMRRVELPPNSPRGGILTQGTVLAVTSNPTRTSPVKRGVFILDAILGTRPPPPPPNIPALEDAASPEKLRTMTLRENLALHASNKSCAACHSRMDPLGLALENFNAMGSWRERDLGRPIESAGKLITGEKFADIRELKHVLATSRHRDFYYCFTEKMMTYALGRALDYYDVDTVDRLVESLEQSGGRPSTLLTGIINSAAFQQRRAAPNDSGRAHTSVATRNVSHPLEPSPRL